MKQKVTKLGGMVLLVVLITSLLAVFVGSGLVAASGTANPVRVLPDTVYPGEEFQVTVTFTSPFADFNGVATTDLAPSGWNVSVDKTWCAPPAYDCYTPIPERAEYIWDGVYAASVPFTEMYKVQVPSGAALGIYNFTDGTLGYYNGTDPDPIFEPITGEYQVEVVIPHQITFETYPPGTGTITFAGVGYSDGDTADKTAGIYTITAHPGTGYSFVSWNTTGLLSVTNTTSPSTTCTVSGAGTLKMVLTATAPAVGGTAHPISKVAIVALWIALGAAIIAGASLLVRRRRAHR